MVLEIALGGASADDVDAALERAGDTLGVEVKLRELDSDAL